MVLDKDSGHDDSSSHSDVEVNLLRTKGQLDASRQHAKNLEENLSLLRKEYEHLKNEKRKIEDEKLKEKKSNFKKVKLPSFRPEMPDLWFIQIEAIFDDFGITREEEKYRIVISQGEGPWLVEINDLIRAGPNSIQPYTHLKKEIINRFSLSEGSRLKKLLEEEEIGDLKPSQFLRRLKTVAGGTPIADNIMKPLWLSRLPNNVQGILQAQPSSNTLNELAEIADRISETMINPQTQSAVHSISHNKIYTPPQPIIQNSTEELKQMLTAMGQKFELLTVKMEYLEKSMNQNRNRSRSRSQSRGRSYDSKPFTSEKGFCYYHENFGEQARRCQQPCKYKPASNSNGSQ